MTKPRPSNIAINIFVAIALLFGFFVLGAIFDRISKQFQQNNVEAEEPEQKLLNQPAHINGQS